MPRNFGLQRLRGGGARFGRSGGRRRVFFLSKEIKDSHLALLWIATA